MNYKFLIFVLAETLFVSSAISDEIRLYRCQDSNGQLTITNTKINNECKDLSISLEKSKAGLAALRAEEKKLARELIGKSPTHLEKLILNKRIKEPDQIVESVSGGVTIEKWLYKYTTIIIVNGKITEIITIK